MTEYTHHTAFGGRLVIIGFGSIGQGVLPLILRHIDMPVDRIVIITADDNGRAVAEQHGVAFRVEPVTRENYEDLVGKELTKGDFLLNLSVDVSSIALAELARDKGALYLDTCIEPWVGGYTDTSLPPSLRSNYALREEFLAKRRPGKKDPTAVITHGANPGLVSHFVKQALLNIAADTGVKTAVPADRAGWSNLAKTLGVKVIHIAERDTQVSATPKKVDEFVNTWSIDGFVSEGSQPTELGWGTHERHWPFNASRHAFGSDAAIFLNRPGASTRVRTWTPTEGHFHGFLITHSEAISIADYYTVTEEQGTARSVTYRPTVHYAYHPCDAAVMSVHELAGKNWVQQKTQRLMVDEVISGIDELGVLLAGHAKNAYWYGSQLSIEEARKLCPHNNATSLQVTVAVLGGMVWAMENPEAGIVEPDELDFKRVLDVCMPYLGPVVGVYSDWTPLLNRGELFAEDVDHDDPWQFKNVLVV
ncbi:MAG: saccharopine dehydrogenase NADP-binding domain-containing protein [Alphaproteobacteria bacterium]|nr:saccharopine dehydrogenase NADP-binding domain-containing protein [Alphaproteobacteria bacterium]MBU0797623.1 saccharopine dehydrogenase NADP-binding domain-containing protein [Alphaproteobacteria bacterium]MBU0889131.1 saccharopine dehydrogenase NADP-binding domain-containing protein [Alphaproteobacteria bacterium]MBU1812165.1 saccharopine dehydrogenase NADP-binding domain-containing protein [Alphaproteobacteria bacterium]MBU2090178.1 saccharopine dehydrogenase NADP-binding domain-containin